jgi:hypothetical protein
MMSHNLMGLVSSLKEGIRTKKATENAYGHMGRGRQNVRTSWEGGYL